MNNNINIEEIKLLLPDYITGTLNEEDKLKVEDALASLSPLNEMYHEMKEALDFAGSVHAEEPAPQYWNNLLPRIHERIDAKAKSKVSYVWKVLLPAAAVLLIFIIYRISFTPETEISEKIINKTNNEKAEIKDTIEKKIENIETPVQEKENISDVNNAINKPHYVKRGTMRHIEGNVANESNQNTDNEKLEKIKIDITENDDFASVTEVDDYSVFGAGVPGSIDEETADELNKLNDNEQNDLLETLSKSNL